MYNVKVLKYPSGWQIRVYNQLIGCAEDDTVLNPDAGLETVSVWNGEIEDYEQVVCKPSEMWENPFTLEYEKAPTELREPNFERSAQVSMNRTVNRVYHLARSNWWDWFITLTFNPDKVDSFNYDECVKKLSNWLTIMRRSCPDLQYIVVPERHESGRFHFHGLFANCDGMEFVDSGKKTKSGDVIYNVGNYKLGFTTATRVNDNSRVTKYLSKYITKDLCAVSFGRKRYWASRNLNDTQACEYILEYEDLKKLIEQLDSECQHKKLVESDIVNTVYYEMGVSYGL